MTKNNSKTIYFFRHGEDINDVRERYGGWSDPNLSLKGRKLARKKSDYFKDKSISTILTSPLRRAKETALIIGRKLDVQVEKFAYLKERNTYGILGGLSKKYARKRYPEMVKAYNAQEYIAGAERYSDFKNRIDTLLTKLLKMRYSVILCITHGYIITTIMEEFLGLNRKDIKDGALLGLRVEGNKYKVIVSKNLTFSEGERTYDSERYRKFK